jgi:hypothetical protein
MTDAIKVLSGAEILAAQDLPVEPVPVPEWGGSVMVKGLSLAAYEEIQEKCTVNGDVDGSEANVHMLAATIMENRAEPDEDGGDVEPDWQPAFSLEQARLLRDKSVVAVGRVLGKAGTLTGLGEDVTAEAERTFPEGVSGSE